MTLICRKCGTLRSNRSIAQGSRLKCDKCGSKDFDIIFKSTE